MCGRYEAGQKQKIAEAFHVSVMLDDVYFGQGKVSQLNYYGGKREIIPRGRCQLIEKLILTGRDN
jgi:hypothetical protein